MAEIDFTKQEQIQGALDCMKALDTLIKSAEDMPDEIEPFQDKQLAVSNSFADNFEPMPPRVRGALVALAEYIHSCESVGTPYLDKWKPDSAMTHAERMENIEQLKAVLG